MSAPIDVAVEGAISWVSRRVTAPVPLRPELISAGRSNLTYRLVAQDGRSWVLRRPPVGELLPGAHDMRREFRILTDLHAEGSVPVPHPLLLCEDLSLVGVPFYVMSDVAGVVLRAPSDVALLDCDARVALCESVVDVLAKIHAVDLEATNLGELGPHTDYVERQVRRWLRHVQATGVAESIFATQAVALRSSLPAEVAHTLVHGDYRLDNLIVCASDGGVRAVVDWEIGTIGDPLADLASFLISWDQPGDVRPALGAPGATAAGRFLDRTAMVERYVSLAGRGHQDVDRWLDFYCAFAYWKLACILHGVATRYRAGGGGGAKSPPADEDHIRWLLARSVAFLTAHRRGQLAFLTEW